MSLQYLKRPESTHAQGSIPIDVIRYIDCNVEEYAEPHSFQLVSLKGARFGNERF